MEYAHFDRAADGKRAKCDECPLPMECEGQRSYSFEGKVRVDATDWWYSCPDHGVRVTGTLWHNGRNR